MYIISIIIYNGCIYYIYRCSDLAGEIDILILGAWGCGAFGHALNSLASLCRMVYIIYIYGNYRIFIYIYTAVRFCRQSNFAEASDAADMVITALQTYLIQCSFEVVTQYKSPHSSSKPWSRKISDSHPGTVSSPSTPEDGYMMLSW